MKRISSEYNYGEFFLFGKELFYYQKLVELLEKKRLQQNFIQIQSPFFYNNFLWKKTKHWSFYKQNMFVFKKHSLKPMNCPAAMLFVKKVLNSTLRFPIKIFEIGRVFRNEPRGSLKHDERLISFILDDMHILVDEFSIKKEISILISDICIFYNLFNLSIEFFLSTKPNDIVSHNTIWEKSTQILKDVLQQQNIAFSIDCGEGAFYGPKIDICTKKNEKNVQLATIQLDFFLTKRLDIKINNVFPVVIHSALLGSFERFLAVIRTKSLSFWMYKIPFIIIRLTEKVNIIEQKIKNFFDRKKIEYLIVAGEDVNKILKMYSGQVYSFIFLGNKEVEKKVVTCRFVEKSIEKKFSLLSFKNFINSEKKKIEKFFI